MQYLVDSRNITAAYQAVQAERTISHEVARGLAWHLGTPAEGGAVGEFVRTGELPGQYVHIMELHADLFLHDSEHDCVYQAMARYFRDRYRNRQAGAGIGWRTLIGQHAVLASAA